MGGPPMGGPPMGGPPMGAPAGDAPNFILWIILGVVSGFLCQGWLFAIIGAILAFLAKSEWDKGNAEGARGKLKISKILIILNFVLMALIWIGYIILMVVAGASGGMNF